MSKIVESLRKYAAEEKQAHEEYIKDFTASTIAHLVQGGVDKDKAGFLAKEACLRDDNLVKSVNKAIILEKIADYVDSLEAENAKLQVKIDTQSPESNEKQAEIPEHLRKLASFGFTEEEIEAMSNVPASIMEKVANVASQPWELGKGVGPSAEKLDPILEFILS